MNNGEQKSPTKHISIRVPWHDNEWNGTICQNPSSNISCLILRDVANKKRDDKEDLIAGESIQNLDLKSYPPCVKERMAFMAPFNYSSMKEYPYNKQKDFKHIKNTHFNNPAFSAQAVPFRWMLLQNFDIIKADYNLNIDYTLETELRQETGLKSSWINHYENQKEILNSFFSHVKHEESLVFFYAKKVPFVEDYGRVLIGVGKVKKIDDAHEYEYDTPNNGIKAMIWERNLIHSINNNFEDGFLLPYHQALEFIEKNPKTEFKMEDLVVLAPEDKINEFSYVSEHVSNDTAIDTLLAFYESLQKCEGTFNFPWKKCMKWIEDAISEIWKMRGPYPGLGSALRAFGLDFGNLMAIEIDDKSEDGQDPWIYVEKCFEDPGSCLSPHLANQINIIIQDLWHELSEQEKKYLKLLSRFDLNSDQAKLLFTEEGLNKLEEHWNKSINYEEILNNPYLIFEFLRHTPDPISFLTIDHGAFPEEEIKNKYPLPEESVITSDLDPRRIKALIIDILEKSTYEGHTLLPANEIVNRIQETKLNPSCNVDERILKVAEKYFDKVIIPVEMSNDKKAYQLDYLANVGNTIREVILNRKDSKKLEIKINWEQELNNFLDKKKSSNTYDPKPCEKFLGISSNNEENKGVSHIDEEKARKEKSSALEEISKSKVSVLIGSAGSGKTTLLAALCNNPIVKEEGILLLAPTGKARVKMEQAIGLKDLNAYTVAQYLFRSKRFDPETGRFIVTKKNQELFSGTVIIDEASMLTEEMLASLLDAIIGFKRLILVGDPQQLPPIGTGRPFVDIVSLLKPEDIEYKFPKVGNCYAELTINRRQLTSEQSRADIEFSNWFKGDQINAYEDDVFEDISKLKSSDHLKFVKWHKEDDFKELLLKVLAEELNLENIQDFNNFNKSIGAFGGKFDVGAASMAECWQILSPVRNWKHGVMEINRAIHKNFKTGQAITKFMNKSKPYPMGLEGIMKGEKVINVRNHIHDKYDFKEGKKSNGYVANGEIGIVVREFGDYTLNIEFSSQPTSTFGFDYRYFEEGKENYSIELAYALTVHKSQGSEFGKVILIIPDPCPLVSRELIYTALTRQKQGIILLHQGNPFDLLKYSSPEHSETLKRYTNLFRPPEPKEINGKFLEKYLIHTTSRGEAVRSKSEVIIADRLDAAGIDYFYEKELKLGNVPKYPDFTIVKEKDGESKLYYWEHLGMLTIPEYKKKWDKKLKLYRENGITPFEEGEGKKGTLIITCDDKRGGISSQSIDDKIKEVLL